jgi:hypothetical protein
MTFFGFLILIYCIALFINFTDPDENDTLAIFMIFEAIGNILSIADDN